MFDTADRESVVEILKNEFQNEEASWYSKAADKVIAEQEKDGDSTANIINRLFR